MTIFYKKNISWQKKLIQEYQSWINNQTQKQAARWFKIWKIMKFTMALHVGWTGLTIASEINNRRGHYPKKMAVLSSNYINWLDRGMMTVAAPFLGTYDLSGGSYVHRYWLTLPLNYHFNRNGYQVDWYEKASGEEYKKVMTDPSYQAVTLIGHGDNHSWGIYKLPQTNSYKSYLYDHLDSFNKDIIIKLTCGSNVPKIDLSPSEHLIYGSNFSHQYYFNNLANFKLFLSYQGLINQVSLFLDTAMGLKRITAESGLEGDIDTVLKELPNHSYSNLKTYLYQFKQGQKYLWNEIEEKKEEVIYSLRLFHLFSSEKEIDIIEKKSNKLEKKLITEIRIENQKIKNKLFELIKKSIQQNSYHFNEFSDSSYYDWENNSFNEFILKNLDWVKLFNEFLEKEAVRDQSQKVFKKFNKLIIAIDDLNLSSPLVHKAAENFHALPEYQKPSFRRENEINIFEKGLDLKNKRNARAVKAFYEKLNKDSSPLSQFFSIIGMITKPTVKNKVDTAPIEPLLINIFEKMYIKFLKLQQDKADVYFGYLAYRGHMQKTGYFSKDFLKKLDLKIESVIKPSDTEIFEYLKHKPHTLIYSDIDLKNFKSKLQGEYVEKLEDFFILNMIKQIKDANQRGGNEIFKNFMEYLAKNIEREKFKNLYQKFLSGQTDIPQEIIDHYRDDLLKMNGYNKFSSWIIKTLGLDH